MGKGSSGTNTTTNSSTPPPEVMAQYSNLIGQANQVSTNPLNQYGGSMVAGFTPDQLSGFNTINNSQGISAPYINQAQNMINSSTQPLWNSAQQYSPQAIQNYYNPYQQDVVNSTMANINETNAQQNQQVIGNAISKGAWGGDRAGVAQGELARQQGLASNQTLAQLQQQGFTGAQQQFNQQQGAQLGANTTNAWLNSQGAFGEANLGNQAQSNALQGAAAQLATGQQQQTLAQSALNIPYEQFMQQQAYPYQNLSWLSGISTGLGSGMGGTSTSSSPAPSATSGILGGILGAAGTAGSLGWNPFGAARGGKIPEHTMARGGFCKPGYDNGGMIPNIDLSYIPNIQMTRGSGIPGVPPALKPQESGSMGGFNPSSIMSSLAKGNGKSGSGGTSSAFDSLMQSLGNQAFNAGAGGESSISPGLAADMASADTAATGASGMADAAGSAGISSGIGDMLSSLWAALPSMAEMAAMFALKQGGAVPPRKLADGGMSDDDAAKIANLYGNSDDSSSPYDTDLAAAKGFTPNALPTPPANSGITPADKYGAIPTYDGARAAPINKVDPWQALAAAGFGMMAGQSPQALVNIGTGAQAGIKNLQEQKEQAAKESMEQGTLQQQGEHLYDQANEWRSQLFQTGEHQKATEDIQRQELKLKKEQIEQGKYSMSPFGQVLNTRTGEVNGGMPGTASMVPLGPDGNPMSRPVGADGKPAPWPEYLASVQKANPDLGNAAQKIIDGDAKWASKTSRSDPLWKAATNVAMMADPTVTEERYSNKQKFEADNKGQMDSFNTIPSHLQVLEGAAKAIDNGDSRALNTIKNAWNKQFGSELPTNLDTARTLVSAEIVKAITGAGGVTDREDAQKKFSDAASQGQLTGAIDMTKHLIGERINSAAYRYKQTVGGNYYKYIRPDVQSYLGVGTEIDPTGSGNVTPAVGAKPAGAAPKTVVKTQTSPSTGKKKIIYSDGTEEIK